VAVAGNGGIKDEILQVKGSIFLCKLHT
jgi:hypothetical protein